MVSEFPVTNISLVMGTDRGIWLCDRKHMVLCVADRGIWLCDLKHMVLCVADRGIWLCDLMVLCVARMDRGSIGHQGRLVRGLFSDLSVVRAILSYLIITQIVNH